MTEMDSYIYIYKYNVGDEEHLLSLFDLCWTIFSTIQMILLDAKLWSLVSMCLSVNTLLFLTDICKGLA